MEPTQHKKIEGRASSSIPPMSQSAVGSLRKQVTEIIENEKYQNEEKVDKLINTLTAAKKAGIDPETLNQHRDSEFNRNMKSSFGIAFLLITIGFTSLSYYIVVFNVTNNWKIPDAAITALVIEAPIQFIGLLYIIAKNLFPTPQKASKNAE